MERRHYMADDGIRYDLLTQNALRGVVHEVLTQVQRDGLPGEHHLYIAFDTCAEGVSISKRLKEQYPEEMTVVLQYQFWDLFVWDERFEVKLSFTNVPERLVIPFDSVKAFYDPSAQFGLQFGKPDGKDPNDHGIRRLQITRRLWRLGSMPPRHPAMAGLRQQIEPT